MSSIQIIEEDYVPYSVAKEILKEAIESGSSSSILQKTFEYLNSLEKCSAENARKLMEELKGMISKKEVMAMISSLCPDNPDGLRAILTLEGKTFSQEELEKILDLIKRYRNN
ncbi:MULTISPECIES: DNA-directed RNA polymerase subunit F [Metallosphaera]|uniref:DNA-directed RNA polymerase subunit Rpo4 n=3 Tax=Metallosphaera TaxID=41980 RepID=A4YCT7_METS5|nr:MULTISPECIES: DNA-directed RNA polymerase subunit F [Metallosphaera]ABP94239.1 DNA-directed RNA polymerase, subunit F [Metallosphaera sedula DSM 5348]AIM26226.1 DNA-directed RNA polymerase, subunit F [Metallosphaera sedula]AKV73247.1 DNA-directed RNA polymerase subunit F [Metallosphaera sedula]AKV75491.1 DNA-directed RNA polymerase subunit F [Metallosphaera sedula]AKV77737.1 DNA-directed RNA polymerase subunit F [Metallosphaera sedula]